MLLDALQRACVRVGRVQLDSVDCVMTAGMTGALRALSSNPRLADTTARRQFM